MSVRLSNGTVSLGLIIAIAIASLVLGLTFVPGVLIYPEEKLPVETSSSEKLSDNLEAVLQASNSVLEDHIAALESQLDAGVCIADGRFQLTDTGSPVDFKGALSAGPYVSTPIVSALPPGIDHSGSTAQWIASGIVQIEGQGGSLGSGFYIASDIVVTSAANLLTGQSEVVIIDPELGSVSGSVVAANGDRSGLAAIRTSSRDGGAYFLGASGAPGQVATSIGYSVDKSDGSTSQPSVNTGLVTAKSDESGSAVLYHTALAGSTLSGSPLFDSCGRVVGVHTGDAEQFYPKGLIGRVQALSSVQKFLTDNDLQPVLVDSSMCQFEIRNDGADGADGASD